jgi:hypothetical protein
MNCEKINVRVARQVMDDMSVDLPSFLNAVYASLLRNFQLFGAEEKYDIFPEEVSLSSVVVYNHKNRSYTRAVISTDGDGNVSFSDIERVRRQWVPVDTVERSDDEYCIVEMARRETIWSSVLGY